MSAKYSGISDVPLSMAVFLAADKYDHNPNEAAISATSIMRPVRQLVLTRRAGAEFSEIDLRSMVASRIGTAIHDGIEDSWKNHYQNAMRDLGYPQKVIDRIKINPNKEDLKPDDLPVYLELRAGKKIGDYYINGKFDIVINGRVEDFKTTSTYTYINGLNDEKHQMQLSIYRWLNPEIITDDYGAIQYIFTDWQAFRAKTDKGYPAHRHVQKLIHLLSPMEVEQFVRSRLDNYIYYKDAPEPDLPLCDDNDLWRSETVWKYYKNVNNMARSTKNFNNLLEAQQRFQKDGSVGTIVEVPGQVSACKYCPAFNLCTQKDALIQSGELILD